MYILLFFFSKVGLRDRVRVSTDLSIADDKLICNLSFSQQNQFFFRIYFSFHVYEHNILGGQPWKKGLPFMGSTPNQNRRDAGPEAVLRMCWVDSSFHQQWQDAVTVFEGIRSSVRVDSPNKIYPQQTPSASPVIWLDVSDLRPSRDASPAVPRIAFRATFAPHDRTWRRRILLIVLGPACSYQ